MKSKPKKSDKLSGVVVPIITPVDKEDCIDEEAFRKLIRRLIASGVNGIFVGGSAGEGPLLTEKEWVRMMEIAFDENSGAVYLLGGVSDTSTRKSVAKIKTLKTIGYEHFVVTPTFYIAIRSADEHLRLFGECKTNGEDMKMIAYNIPSCTGSKISIETMCEMARRGWIEYCKEASGDITYFWRLITEGNKIGLKVFMGDEGIIMDGLAAGACGIVPVCANYEPGTYIRTYQAAISEDWAQVMRLQKRIMYLRSKLPLNGSCWISGIKYAVSKLGIGTGKPVSPLQPLNNAQKKTIDKIIPPDCGWSKT